MFNVFDIFIISHSEVAVIRPCCQTSDWHDHCQHYLGWIWNICNISPGPAIYTFKLVWSGQPSSNSRLTIPRSSIFLSVWSTVNELYNRISVQVWNIENNYRRQTVRQASNLIISFEKSCNSSIWATWKRLRRTTCSTSPWIYIGVQGWNHE